MRETSLCRLVRVLTRLETVSARGSGTTTSLTGTARTLRGPRVVRDSQAVTLTLNGVPGQEVELAVAIDGLIQQYDAAQSGVTHLTTTHWRPLGTVSPSGTLFLSFKLPKFRPDDPGLTWFTQARFRDTTSGSTRLSNAWAIVEVDSTD